MPGPRTFQPWEPVLFSARPPVRLVASCHLSTSIRGSLSPHSRAVSWLRSPRELESLEGATGRMLVELSERLRLPQHVNVSPENSQDFVESTTQGRPTREMLPAARAGRRPTGGDLSLEPGQQASLGADHTLQGAGAPRTHRPSCLLRAGEERWPSQTI